MNIELDPRTERWLLPDGVNELLPHDAWKVEKLRRVLIDNGYRWGYDLVMPPMIEYLDSLLTGTGETLDVQTFKFIDQQNGRTLGVRADMTPQVARIDAHAMRTDQPNRLFYTGSVLRARSDGLGGSRTPLQFGAELFGHAGPESDIEIIQLMIENARLSGVSLSRLLLDLGHVGVFKNLLLKTQLNDQEKDQLFHAFLRGSIPDVEAILAGSAMKSARRNQLLSLFQLNGRIEEVLQKAEKLFEQSEEQMLAVFANLRSIIIEVETAYPDLQIHIDLSELRGYRYHTGVVFALYSDEGIEIARGGRYDSIGQAFGHARPATGFSGDLVKLALIDRPSDTKEAALNQAIYVEPALVSRARGEVRRLRESGERVIIGLANLPSKDNDQCDRKLVFENDRWCVVPARN